LWFGWCCSYHWIKRKGKLAPREIAPIVVSNHVSYIDPIFYFFEFFPTIVAAESHDSMPFVGTIIRAMQVILLQSITLGAIDWVFYAPPPPPLKKKKSK
jgi:1-acyl-sn-glycerol-3-phosphate acyltransferase